jgi:hypothetical protein
VRLAITSWCNLGGAIRTTWHNEMLVMKCQTFA